MNYKDGRKYCRRCEIFLLRLGNFCPCCRMALRKSPTARKQKEKPRARRLLLFIDNCHNHVGKGEEVPSLVASC
jgi:predicted amidophosphoribosyltransferase